MRSLKNALVKLKKDPWLSVLFAIYILFLFWIVILKTRFVILVRPARELNLIPFKFAIESGSASQIFDIIANILVFIPFGLYLKILGMKAKWIVSGAAALSFCFELTQLIFKIGVTDITDLFTNTFGALIGVLACLLLFRYVKNMSKLQKLLRITATVCTSVAVIWFFAALCQHVLLYQSQPIRTRLQTANSRYKCVKVLGKTKV